MFMISITYFHDSMNQSENFFEDIYWYYDSVVIVLIYVYLLYYVLSCTMGLEPDIRNK